MYFSISLFSSPNNLCCLPERWLRYNITVLSSFSLSSVAGTKFISIKIFMSFPNLKKSLLHVGSYKIQNIITISKVFEIKYVIYVFNKINLVSVKLQSNFHDLCRFFLCSSLYLFVLILSFVGLKNFLAIYSNQQKGFVLIIIVEHVHKYSLY